MVRPSALWRAEHAPCEKAAETSTTAPAVKLATVSAMTAQPCSGSGAEIAIRAGPARLTRPDRRVGTQKRPRRADLRAARTRPSLHQLTCHVMNPQPASTASTLAQQPDPVQAGAQVGPGFMVHPRTGSGAVVPCPLCRLSVLLRHATYTLPLSGGPGAATSPLFPPF